MPLRAKQNLGLQEVREALGGPSGVLAGAPLVDEASAPLRAVPVQAAPAAVPVQAAPAAVSVQAAPAAVPVQAAPAAVLVPLFAEMGEARVLLTRRSANLRTHTGEVSFPGGRLDAGETPEDAALREAAEEVSLDPAAVELLGRLSPVSTFSSSATVTPVVGVLDSRPEVAPNLGEVERVFDVSLSHLLDDEVFREELWSVPARGPDAYPVWFFELDQDTIWGATARILVELLSLVLAV
ncbi:MAG TPA: CoA pyrophosphatase [Acidimicrobiales bacterium]|nr:CoA pyrophosphatase [Acidimicrobiales bacterium]